MSGIGVASFVGACVATVAHVAHNLANAGNNTGVLAWPFAAVVYLIDYGMLGVVVTVLISSLSVLALNELGFFGPWPRGRVRVLGIAALVAIGFPALIFYYQFSPFVLPNILD